MMMMIVCLCGVVCVYVSLYLRTTVCIFMCDVCVRVLLCILPKCRYMGVSLTVIIFIMCFTTLTNLPTRIGRHSLLKSLKAAHLGSHSTSVFKVCNKTHSDPRRRKTILFHITVHQDLSDFTNTSNTYHGIFVMSCTCYNSLIKMVH